MRDKVRALFYAELYKLPSDLSQFLIKNTMLAGGCTASVYLGEEPNDYDLYFKDKDGLKGFSFFVEKYSNLVTDTVEGYVKINGQEVAAISFGKIQVIVFALSMHIEGFDYRHCMISYDLANPENDAPINKAQEYIINYKLLINNPNWNGRISATHSSKLKKRGWSYPTWTSLPYLGDITQGKISIIDFMFNKWFEDYPDMEYNQELTDNLQRDYLLHKLLGEDQDDINLLQWR